MTAIVTTSPGKALPDTQQTTMPQSGAESLQRGIIHTDISRSVARSMTILFLTGLALVPLLQFAYEIARHRPMQELDIARPPVHAAKLLAHGQVRESARTLRHWLTKENLAGYEDALKKSAILRHKFQPRMELEVARYLGFGSGMAILGRDGLSHPNGWLFYQLGNDYVAGPGFLQPWFIHHREQVLFNDGETDVNADPRKAIIAFNNDCRAAGVHLIYVPMPVKQMLQPAEMSSRLALSRSIPTPNNPDYPRFLADLRAAGVDVFDPTPATIGPDDPVRYLEQDTHYTPAFMEQIAQALAEHIRSSVSLPAASVPFTPQVEDQDVTNIGDIVRTLELPGSQTLFPPRTITTHRIANWASDPSADILFLGDSFSNIYADPQMHWGDNAGLPQQVSRFLKRPLDVIAINGQAASSVRRELASRPHPLAGKKVVVWEVAMHELSASNWPMIPMPR